MPEDKDERGEARAEAAEEIVNDYDDDDIEDRMFDFLESGSKNRKMEKEMTTDTTGCYALYKLAEFFGYHGIQNEEGLQKFFTEDKKGMMGIYWDGGEWEVNDVGWVDKSVGETLDIETIKKIILVFKKEKGEILEHRSDTIAWGMDHIFRDQVKKMTNILVKAVQMDDPSFKEPELPKPKERIITADASHHRPSGSSGRFMH